MSRGQILPSDARRVFEQACDLAFIEAGQSVPHPDDDPDGSQQRGFCREFVVCLLGQFGAGLAESSVEAGLWPSVDRFWAELDAFADNLEFHKPGGAS